GFGIEFGGVGESLAAGRLDVIVEGDREAAAAGAARVELALPDPDVDDMVADAEEFGELVDAELVVVQRGGRGDAVLPAQPPDAVLVERTVAGGQVTGLV